jgi:hypothetical protein
VGWDPLAILIHGTPRARARGLSVIVKNDDPPINHTWVDELTAGENRTVNVHIYVRECDLRMFSALECAWNYSFTELDDIVIPNHLPDSLQRRIREISFSM